MPYTHLRKNERFCADFREGNRAARSAKSVEEQLICRESCKRSQSVDGTEPARQRSNGRQERRERRAVPLKSELAQGITDEKIAENSTDLMNPSGNMEKECCLGSATSGLLESKLGDAYHKQFFIKK